MAKRSDSGHQGSWCSAECLEAEPLIERRSVLVYGVYDYRANRYLLGCSNNPDERVAEKCSTDPASLLADIDGKAGEDRNWDWKMLRQTLTGFWRGFMMIEL